MDVLRMSEYKNVMKRIKSSYKRLYVVWFCLYEMFRISEI